MKKTILALVLVASGLVVFAQEDSLKNNSTNTSTMSSSSSYNAFGNFVATPPPYVQTYVTRDYPTATDLHWQQMNDWWHGYYMNNGQPMNVYYNTAGLTYTVALPVRQTLIPDNVLSWANRTFGPTIYDITAVKGSSGQDIYLVRTLDNGQVNSQYVDASGNKVIDVYRMETTDANMNNTNPVSNSNMNNSSTNMNNNQSVNANSTTTSSDMNTNNSTGKEKTKIKTVNSNGTKTVTKTKNGKTRTSTSNQNNDQY